MRGFCSRVLIVFPNVIYWIKGKHQLVLITSCTHFGVDMRWSRVMTVVIVGRLNWGRVGWVGQRHINIFGFCVDLNFHCNVLQTPMRFEIYIFNKNKTHTKTFPSCNFELRLTGLFKWVIIKTCRISWGNSHLGFLSIFTSAWIFT